MQGNTYRQHTSATALALMRYLPYQVSKGIELVAAEIWLVQLVFRLFVCGVFWTL